MKQSLIFISLAAMLSGCATNLPKVPEDISSLTDNELCESFGIAYASKDTSSLSIILAEGELRGIEENDTCKMFIELGAQKYYDALDAPSGFQSAIKTLDEIGRMGHGSNHTVEVK
ncbi:lipoprotein [Vibrio vulnificus]|uniref:Lipoprotein n=1 Tax=Vibrio vulnificus TaxID=672 RepID=A0A2S3QYP0_VIBVL|nr:lipoprotein [Vibrio vulnificus]ELL0595313.1 lipoprotein [Vibrio vulnificus]ELP6757243.1 lipoprotein [Vibrio vulnificus]MBN8087370.1 lipoprotein [Vibrio vulnificus]MBN8115889.1 lipoprotein [Vibrio vulnificus]MDK2618522.1 lipoprotein [Vibrio vulnificus]